MASTVKKSDKEQKERPGYITSSPVLSDLLLPAVLYVSKVFHNFQRKTASPARD